MIKILTLLALLGFGWWRVRRYLWRRSLHRQGMEIPQETGPRSVTLLAGIMLAVYGGFLLWHLFGAAASG